MHKNRHVCGKAKGLAEKKEISLKRSLSRRATIAQSKYTNQKYRTEFTVSRETLAVQSAVMVLKQTDNRVILKMKINDQNVEMLYDPGTSSVCH